MPVVGDNPNDKTSAKPSTSLLSGFNIFINLACSTFILLSLFSCEGAEFADYFTVALILLFSFPIGLALYGTGFYIGKLFVPNFILASNASDLAMARITFFFAPYVFGMGGAFLIYIGALNIASGEVGKGCFESSESISKNNNTAFSGAKAQSHILIAEIQRGLNEAGYSPGKIDGVFGEITSDAISQYQFDNDLAVDGKASQDLLEHIDSNLKGLHYSKTQNENGTNVLKWLNPSTGQILYITDTWKMISNDINEVVLLKLEHNSGNAIIELDHQVTPTETDTDIEDYVHNSINNSDWLQNYGLKKYKFGKEKNNVRFYKSNGNFISQDNLSFNAISRIWQG